VASGGERGSTCERKTDEDGKIVFQGKYSQEVEEQMKSFYEMLSEKVYKTARKASDDFRQHMPIVFDDFLGQWNYRAIPQVA
jgi:hypothetical protein